MTDTSRQAISDALESVRRVVHYHCGDDCHEDERGHSSECAFEAFEVLKNALTPSHDLAGELEVARRKEGLSLRELADATGVSFSNIAKIIRRETAQPTAKIEAKLRKWLDAATDGDQCDLCGRNYTAVFSVPNELWSKIAPDNASLGEHIEHQYGGLLCPSCATDEAAKIGVSLQFVAETPASAVGTQDAPRDLVNLHRLDAVADGKSVVAAYRDLWGLQSKCWKAFQSDLSDALAALRSRSGLVEERSK